jgi:hypothetical protein
MRIASLVLFLCACGGTKATTTVPPVTSASATPTSDASAPIVQATGDAGIPRIDPAAVQSVIRGGGAHFKLCYLAALKKQKGLAGRVETKFVIDETGHVISAEDVTRSNVLQDDDARNCVVSKFKMLEFPPPQPSGKVTINYPFLFDPSMAAEAASAADAGAPAATDDYAHTRPPFNPANAAAALGPIDVKACASAGYHGVGHVKVTFDPSGVVTKTEVDAPANLAKPAAACVSKAFSAARVSVFGGAAVVVGKSFTIP